MDKFKTIKQNAISNFTEKKSKFIGKVFYIETVQEAEEIIKNIKKENADARHNIYAYSVTSKLGEYTKSSDDGEPSGTAGIPVLNVIKQNNLSNVLIIITRYFGGILLGTGGLCRAYTKSAVMVLEEAEIIEKTLGYIIKLQTNYEDLEKLKYFCKQSNINIIKVEFLDNINVIIEIPQTLEEGIKGNIDKLFPNLTGYDILQEKNIIINP